MADNPSIARDAFYQRIKDTQVQAREFAKEDFYGDLAKAGAAGVAGAGVGLIGGPVGAAIGG